MTELAEYVFQHTERGECHCGKCVDVGEKPDPTGHTVDMVFFKVAAKNSPERGRFIELTNGHQGEFGEGVNPFDGQEHSYLELGGWIGDQGLAMMYMALGVSLGVFNLLSPAILGIDGPTALQMAGMGFLSIQVPDPPQP
jgi:hypothetical protein